MLIGPAKSRLTIEKGGAGVTLAAGSCPLVNVDQRHTSILHGSHQITKLLIQHLHVTHHHAGPSTLMGILAAITMSCEQDWQ